MGEAGRRGSAAQGLQPGRCPLEPVTCPSGVGEVEGRWEARQVLIRLDHPSLGLAPLLSAEVMFSWIGQMLDSPPPHLPCSSLPLLCLGCVSVGGDVYLQMTLPKEMPFCPALLGGRREEATPVSAQSVPRVLPTVLSSGA